MQNHMRKLCWNNLFIKWLECNGIYYSIISGKRALQFSFSSHSSSAWFSATCRSGTHKKAPFTEICSVVPSRTDPKLPQPRSKGKQPLFLCVLVIFPRPSFVPGPLFLVLVELEALETRWKCLFFCVTISLPPAPPEFLLELYTVDEIP